MDVDPAGPVDLDSHPDHQVAPFVVVEADVEHEHILDDSPLLASYLAVDPVELNYVIVSHSVTSS